jgi:hypothetical protein
MRYLCLIFLLLLVFFEAKAQVGNGELEKEIYGIHTGNLGIWIYSEHRLANQVALRNEIGFDTGSAGANLQYITGITFTPVIAFEPRWYYNVEKRTKKSKTTDNNSANFVTVRVSYNPNLKIISNQQGNRNIASHIAAIPTWGIRRVLNENFSFETGIGCGYSYTLVSETGQAGEQGMILNLHLRFGYIF